ncbi:putative glucan endo-1,3-beta-glucosidase GVI [Senna tora]|uniref:glucan endo-1,3-beta-D-glucosidase n=1 Tax=Senna tora TaxID=362788 RepID=A0A834TCU7_9FABA|nr:putative glucan endo-1,3-beta-glucosidase GVI [Senna tora]
MMMTSWRNIFLFTTIASLLALQFPPSLGSFGVNYGRKGDNLPPPPEVISLYKRCGIQLLRLFDPTQDALDALRGSDLQVSLGVLNEDLQSISSSPDAALQWVNANVAPYKNDVNFKWITLGNEVIPGDQATYVPRAMTNIQTALTTIGLTTTKVTTAISMAAVTNTYPPSNGAFADQAADVMREVVGFLAQNGSPLMLNTYPYQAYASEPDHISLAYATFQAQEPVVIDGDLKYFNLFDAMVDSVYAALEKVGGSGVPILVSETGWPTQGNDPYTSKENAQVYNQKLLAHVGSGEGTPRRPGQAVDAFIFAMFNEDQKEGTVEQNWGIFNPDMSPVYSLLNC